MARDKSLTASPGLSSSRYVERRAQRRIAPTLEPLRIVGGLHQHACGRRSGAASQQGSQQVMQVGRCPPPGGMIGRAPKHIDEGRRGVWHRLAIDGRSRNLRQLRRPCHAAARRRGCRVRPASRPLRRHASARATGARAGPRGGMEAGDVVGAVAASQHHLVDRNRVRGRCAVAAVMRPVRWAMGTPKQWALGPEVQIHLLYIIILLSQNRSRKKRATGRARPAVSTSRQRWPPRAANCCCSNLKARLPPSAATADGWSTPRPCALWRACARSILESKDSDVQG